MAIMRIQLLVDSEINAQLYADLVRLDTRRGERLRVLASIGLGVEIAQLRGLLEVDEPIKEKSSRTRKAARAPATPAAGQKQPDSVPTLVDVVVTQDGPHKIKTQGELRNDVSQAGATNSAQVPEDQGVTRLPDHSVRGDALGAVTLKEAPARRKLSGRMAARGMLDPVGG